MDILRGLLKLLNSEVAWPGRIRYLADRLCRRWGFQNDSVTLRSRHGGYFTLRRGTTDFRVFEEIFLERAYTRFRHLFPVHTTILDLGANVGLSALDLCWAMPQAQLIAVEPDTGNFEMLLQNLRSAGIFERAQVVQAFAGASGGFAAVVDSGNGAWGFRKGPCLESGVPVLEIRTLLAGLKDVVMKCDIEGSECELFERLADWEDLVALILLELHTEFLSLDELQGTLRRSKFEWTLHGKAPPGSWIVTLALERKALKRCETTGRLATLYERSF